MKLIEALALAQEAAAGGAPPFRVVLACGFTPLHLQTFLAGYLQARLPSRRAVVEPGLFGDLAGSVARLAGAGADAAVVVVEWADLDPRLGLRRLGGWRPADLPDVARTARDALRALRDAVAAAGGRFPVAVAPPSLPLPPIAFAAPWQASALELDLRAALASFLAEVAAVPLVRVVAADELARRSPPATRADVRGDLDHGHPYVTAHDDALADLLARLVAPPAAKKGLVTDLDDTLWRGIVGDIGPAGVRWDLDGHAQAHGLYQQLLAALAGQGVLLAVASKNDRAVVDAALARPDLAIDPARLFPVEVHWGPKSESIARILRAWNVGAGDVVFVDDSPMEVAEVKAAFPGIEAIHFPAGDAAGVVALLRELRALFGREAIAAEDAIRLATLRAGAEAEEDRRAGASPEAFLQQIEARVEIGWKKLPFDPRALELLNKTNQWNLNGRRVQEAEWLARLEDPETFLMVVAYRDKYGPLGKIAIAQGRRTGPREIALDAWAMSCRAFARRVEHRCLEQMMVHLDADAVTLDYAPTDRNGVLRDFLADLLGAQPAPGSRVTREALLARCPPLYHEVADPGA